jgi:hypothetical protein
MRQNRKSHEKEDDEMNRIDWTAFWANVRGFFAGLAECAKDVWGDPLARAAILWVMRRYVPALFAFTRPSAAKLTLLAHRSASMRGMARPSIQEADDMIHKIGLHVFPGFWDIPQTTRDRMCNGMGADSFGEWLREALNDYGRAVVWCSFIHDPAFYLPWNDGTRLRWQEWTQEVWEINSALCVAYAKLSADNWWQRFRIEAHAGIIAEALRVGAFQAYREAFVRGETLNGD